MKVTLLDDTVADIDPDTVKEISQNMGNVFPRYNRCGVHPLFGRALCPDCKANGIEHGCERHYVYSVRYSDPEPIEIQLKDGRTLYAKDFEKAGPKLDEEDIKRTMEEKSSYDWKPLSGNRSFADISIGQTLRDTVATEQYTFTVILPNNERRTVKAAYMEVDGATLYFEDEDRETILTFGPGHWVWAERVEEDE